MVNDLVEGKIPAAYAGVIAFVEQHRSGRLRMLVTSGPQRVAAAKDVPTAAELGYPALLMDEWYGFFARAGTQAPLIEEWNRELSTVLASSGVSSQLAQLGVEVASSTPQECAERLERHLQRWRDVLESFDIKPFN
jgi:tripartite-type tricarboxylate transporter receptor subunit TctC